MSPSFANTYSLAFDGVDDFVNAGSSIPNLQTGDISFSTWIYPTSFSSYNYFLDSGAITTKKGIFAGLQITTGFVSISRRTGVTDTRCMTGFVDCGLTINNWYNIVGVFDEDGGTAGVGQLKLYVNGVLKATVDGSGQDTGTGYDLHIGKSENNFSHFVGNIDEVSLYNSPLTAENVTSIYNSGVPNDLSSLNPVAWYRNGDNGSYKSPQWLLPNNSNKDKVSNYSFEFDGVDDYVDFGNPASLQITGALSISAWVKFTGNDMALVTKSNTSGGDRSYGLWVDDFGGTHQPTFFIYNSSTLHQTPATGARVDDGNWHHLLAVFNPSTYLRLYVDGNLEQENTTSIPASIDNDPANFVIGGTGSGTFLLNGNVDEVAVWNSDQSSNVASIYNSGTPTTITGATAYWKMGEGSNFTDNWLVNNSALSNYSTRSFSFDGVDDYMTVATPTTLTDFTTSVWLHRTGNGNFDGIFGQDSSTAKGGILRYVSLDGTNITLFLTSGWTAMSGALAIDTWHHFALTYDSTANELKSYINGSLYTTISSPDFSGQNTNAHSFSRIGMRNGSTATSFPGLLDEIALWNTAKSASDITAIYNSGVPTTIRGAVAHWRMGENATFNTNWSIPDQVGSSTVASVNMTIADLEGDAPNYTGGGLSANMTIEDRVGDAPNSTNNAVSFNMTESDRETDVPS